MPLLLYICRLVQACQICTTMVKSMWTRVSVKKSIILLAPWDLKLKAAVQAWHCKHRSAFVNFSSSIWVARKRFFFSPQIWSTYLWSWVYILLALWSLVRMSPDLPGPVKMPCYWMASKWSATFLSAILSYCLVTHTCVLRCHILWCLKRAQTWKDENIVFFLGIINILLLV